MFIFLGIIILIALLIVSIFILWAIITTGGGNTLNTLPPDRPTESLKFDKNKFNPI